MTTTVDPKITQSENLKKLLLESNTKQEDLDKVSSYVVTPEAKTVGEKQYNTKLTMQLKETGESHSAAYNRVPPGLKGDSNYTFTYDNILAEKKLTLNNSSEDIDILTGVINKSDIFSQDEKYPFSIRVNIDYTRIEVIPNLDSPCYVGGKEYILKVITKPNVIKIFEPVTYVVSNMAIPDSKWRGTGKQEFISLEVQDANGQTKTVNALIIPYVQTIEGKDYKLNLGQAIGNNRYRLLQDTPRNLVDDSKYTSFYALGKPLGGTELSEEQKTALRTLANDIADKPETIEDEVLTNDSISGSTSISVVKDEHDYKFKVLKTKVQDIIYSLLTNHEEGDPIENNVEELDNRFRVVTDEEYRKRYPEEELIFQVDTSDTAHEMTVELLNVTDYTNTTGPRTARNTYGDYDKFNHVMRFIRDHCMRKLQKYGMSTVDSNILLASARGNNVWQTITDRFTTFHNGNPGIKQNSVYVDYNITFIAKKGMPIINQPLLDKSVYDTPEKKKLLLEDQGYFTGLLKQFLKDRRLTDTSIDDDMFATLNLYKDNSINYLEKVRLNVGPTVGSNGASSGTVHDIVVDRYANGIKTVRLSSAAGDYYYAIQYPKLMAYSFLPGNRIISNVNREEFAPDKLLNASEEEFTNLMKKYVPDFPYTYMDFEKVKQSMYFLSPINKEFGIGLYFLVKENDIFSNSGNHSYSLVQLRYAK
jgi:hypothetical protein